MTENWLADLHIYLLFKRVKSNGKESQSQDHSRRTQAEKDRKEVTQEASEGRTLRAQVISASIKVIAIEE